MAMGVRFPTRGGTLGDQKAVARFQRRSTPGVTLVDRCPRDNALTPSGEVLLHDV